MIDDDDAQLPPLPPVSVRLAVICVGVDIDVDVAGCWLLMVVVRSVLAKTVLGDRCRCFCSAAMVWLSRAPGEEGVIVRSRHRKTVYNYNTGALSECPQQPPGGDGRMGRASTPPGDGGDDCAQAMHCAASGGAVVSVNAIDAKPLDKTFSCLGGSREKLRKA